MLDDLVAEMKENNDLLRASMAIQRDWRLSLRNGMLAGLGSFLGATLLAAMLVAFKGPVMEALGFPPLKQAKAQSTGR